MIAVRDVEVWAGRLAGVFVHVTRGLPEGRVYPPRTDPVLLDQVGCQYRPRVLGIQVGQPLELVNSDPTVHNVEALGRPGGFNVAMPTQGQRVQRRFKSEQVLFPLRCAVHPWMQAWVGVVAHPYFAVSDADGRFVITDLPAGDYELEAVHPTLGTQRLPFSINAGAATKVELRFEWTPPSQPPRLLKE